MRLFYAASGEELNPKEIKLIITSHDIVSARITKNQKIEITVNVNCKERLESRIQRVHVNKLKLLKNYKTPFYVFYQHKDDTKHLLLKTIYGEDVLYGNKIVVPYQTKEIFNEHKQYLSFFIKD